MATPRRLHWSSALVVLALGCSGSTHTATPASVPHESPVLTHALSDAPASIARASRVPAGARHNIVNTGSKPLKLYTLYAPPNHRDGVVHHTRGDAEADTEQFDGKTSE